MGSSSTSPRVTGTVTTTTPRPPGSRLVSSLTAPAGSSPPATSPSVPRSTSTIGCSLSTPVILTEASSSTPTSSPAPAPVTSRPKPSNILNLLYNLVSYYLFYLSSSRLPLSPRRRRHQERNCNITSRRLLPGNAGVGQSFSVIF